MEYPALTPIDQLQSNDLTVISEIGDADYLLSDREFEYGRLRKFSSSSIERFIDVYDKTFKLQSATIIPKYKLIITNDEVIGKITFRKWRYETDVEFKDGFKASFIETPGSGFFSTKMSWVANDKELLRMAGKLSFSKPKLISVIDGDLAKQGYYLPLLALIGVDISITTRPQTY